jgi:hypothetical protein
MKGHKIERIEICNNSHSILYKGGLRVTKCLLLHQEKLYSLIHIFQICIIFLLFRNDMCQNYYLFIVIVKFFFFKRSELCLISVSYDVILLKNVYILKRYIYLMITLKCEPLNSFPKKKNGNQIYRFFS